MQSSNDVLPFPEGAPEDPKPSARMVQPFQFLQGRGSPDEAPSFQDFVAKRSQVGTHPSMQDDVPEPIEE